MNSIKKLRRKASGIQAKIFRYLLGFCVLLLIILWLFQTVLLDTFYKRIKTKEVQQDAALIVEKINEQNIGDLLQTFSDKGDIYAEIWTPHAGTVFQVRSYQEARQDITNEQRLALFEKAIQNGGSATEFHIGQKRAYGKEQEYVRHAIVAIINQTPGMLLVSTHILPVDATVETLRMQLKVISVIMIICSVGLAWLISRHVSRPIAELNKSARRLGEGEYNVLFAAKGYREIEDLSSTLTQTASDLQKNDILRKELIANVSHDLRTPLTLITGYAEMMRDYPEETSADNMQVIVDESKRLTSLVSDLLDLSKLQAGMHEPVREYFNLTELTADIIGRFAKFREHEQYDITFEYQEEVAVYADPARISQVVYNLIGNAINYTGTDKKVAIKQTTDNEHVWIKITDTGEGLSKEALTNVWNRYYREASVKKKSITGSGLGLSIVQTILEQHPGVEYGVFSEEGEGCCFWFSLLIEKNQEELLTSK